ncbi:MAG TPA: response regulator transcription factor [Polyangia bacterium]
MSTVPRVRVLLVEDHTIVRQGLRALLGTSPDLEVVGEAKDGVEAVRLAGDLQPDVVVLDLSLPALHGTEALRRIKAGTRAKVVVLSMHSSPEVVARARDAGCDGYVVKGGDVAELARAIRDALAGEPYFSPEVRGTSGAEAISDPLGRLSSREREVLALIAEGGTNKSIAAKLGISVHTVNAHRVNLMAKLDLHDAQGLTRFALRHGLIDPR